MLDKFGLSAKQGGYHDGVTTHATKGGAFETINPTTGQSLAQINYATEADINNCVTKAQEIFCKWRNLPAPVRGEYVRKIGEALRANREALGELVSLEMGKSLAEGIGEVQEMIDIADYAVGLSRMIGGRTLPSERPDHRLYEQWHPLGPVLIITAFNFPVAVWSWNALIAAVCGDTIVWKPSLKTPLCSLAVQSIVSKVMQGSGYEAVFQMLLTENKHVESLAKDERLPLVSFTGSCQVGRLVNSWVASRMGRCLLELGGNNAIIIDETARVDLAVRAVVFGAVGTAGQRCTTTRRIIVHEKIYDEVLSKLIAAYKQVKIGMPLDPSNHMGPLIDAQAVDAFKKAIDKAKQEGAKVVAGGKVRQGAGFFVEPTIIEASNDYQIVQQETFCPILYVIKYQNFQDALDMQNGVRQGLSSSLFSESVRNVELFLSARGSDCGLANINIGTSGAEIGGAFGGEKETGGGREAGSDAWKAYMRRQTNTINWGEGLPLAQGIEFDL